MHIFRPLAWNLHVNRKTFAILFGRRSYEFVVLRLCHHIGMNVVGIGFGIFEFLYGCFVIELN